MGEFLLPDIERRLAHAQLAADIGDGGATLRLARGIGDLIFREPELLHRVVLLGGAPGAYLLYYPTAVEFGDHVT